MLGFTTIAVTSIFLLFLNYLLYEPSCTIKRYIFFSLLFSLYGYLTDQIQVKLGVITYESYRSCYLFLWTIFVMYYNDFFARFKDFKIYVLALLGAFGGALAYYSAYQLGAINVGEGGGAALIGFNALNWAVFFPLSLKFVHSEKFWNKILDYSVIYSFDLRGFKRHQKYFVDNYDLESLKHKRVLVTGGTSGIGEGAVKSFLKLGCDIHFSGRDESKARSLISQIGGDHFHMIDLGDIESIANFARDCERFDAIILNAGGMPNKKVLTNEGIELQCASQLLGHMLLIELLREYDKLAPKARFIWVSSGGMYLKKLDIENLLNPKEYDKVGVYANVKRAQVTFVNELAKKARWSNYTHVAMHPGWVRTKGLEEALPGFFKFFARDLRSPEQGADTMVWLALSVDNPVAGAFYFDRKIVSPYVHKSFIPTTEDRRELVELVESNVEIFKGKI